MNERRNLEVDALALAYVTVASCDARSSVAVWHFVIVPIADDRRLVAERRCSVDIRQRADHATYSIFCDRAFQHSMRVVSAAGPGLWNILPSHDRILKKRTYRTIDSGGR